MKVSFELSGKDIRYFRERLKAVRTKGQPAEEKLIVRRAADLVEGARAVEPPEFVLERLVKLEQLIEMLRDADWRLEGRDRARILDALAYFVDPDDLIADKVPGIGYLDDAIMVELVVQELKHEIKAYEDFRTFRATRKKSPAETADQLESRRAALQSRMSRRRRQDRDRRRARGGSTRSPMRIW
jgi:uncharacterized membrane protein YkvA (DUF1232 family)